MGRQDDWQLLSVRAAHAYRQQDGVVPDGPPPNKRKLKRRIWFCFQLESIRERRWPLTPACWKVKVENVTRWVTIKSEGNLDNTTQNIVKTRKYIYIYLSDTPDWSLVWMWAWMNLRQTDDIGQSYQTTFLLLTLPYSILCWWCSSVMSGSRILHILFCCFSQSVFFFFFFSDACRTLVAVLVPVRHCVGVSVCGWRSGWMFAWLMNTSLQPLMKMLPVWLFPSSSVICYLCLCSVVTY